ncbi:acyltransferase [Desulfopila sp. IMCC35008]|uniref:acyltransferase family protein n=1 Tax=Desulfopila sp. IMCC35008 TaxID=2653858 RepID=UPI0013D36F9E|nr:acyltransferase family protein [Desulfopila sp. IMCC35008]
MINHFFRNHEAVKLTLDYPILTPLIIYGALFALIFYPKKYTKSTSFLGREVTDQFRGLAILLVVVGHISVHTLEARQQIYFPVFGQYGVSIFFLLSGFGLARSYANRSLQLCDFFKRRLTKVMIPYWIVTIIIVITDSIFLARGYRLNDILATMLGFNSSRIVQIIDYVRWYITVLLAWYLFFVFFWKISNRKKIRAVCCLSTGVLLVWGNYYYLNIGYAFLSFPCGVWLALYYDTVHAWYLRFNRKMLLLSAVSAIMVNYLFQSYLYDRIDIFLPSVGVAFISECSWILVSLSLIVIGLLLMPYHSLLLSNFGTYSYSIFLLHGCLMVKYDFILYRGYLFITFWIYLLFVIFLSINVEKYVFRKISKVKLLS